MERRQFLIDLSAAGLVLAGVPNALRVTWRPRFTDYPFTLGVASGDATDTGVVLWTRLAPQPLTGGGMPPERVAVQWELATDDAMQHVVKRGVALATPEFAHSVHVELDGLAPDRWYWYRFHAGTETSATGRTRTMPARNARPDRLRFAFVSCQHYEQGLYTAFDHLSREPVDLISHLGDYIYEDGGKDNQVRRHSSAEILTLADYRNRYAQYKSDPALQAAHLNCPWLITWDDHEVDNNYANDVSEHNTPRDEFVARRAAAYQAWWEHMPVRLPRPKSWHDFRIYRDAGFGDLARFWVLDGRQYRSDQACGDGNKPLCAEALDPSRTMLGATQEEWLANGLARSQSQWQVLCNQVMLAPYDSRPGPDYVTSMDQWGGYPVARDRMLDLLAERTHGNAVVITGDIHSSWVNDLPRRFGREHSALVGTEFVGTSITSGGDGRDGYVNAAGLAENPHVKWHNARRGYVSCDVTRASWRADYRIVAQVSTAGAPIETKASFVVEHGRPGANPV